MNIVAYRGPFIEDGDDHPTLDLDVRVSEPRAGWDGIHGGAVKIYGAELIGVVLPFLVAIGVPSKDHYSKPWVQKTD